MPYYHISSSKLAIGSVIDPGNWGETVKTFGWKHGAAFTEVSLEHIRATEFPGKPSRLECAFALDNLGSANVYYQLHHSGEATPHILYEVDFINPGALRHSAHWDLVRPGGSLDLEWARKYWRGEDRPNSPSVHREILTMSPLKIVGVVTGRATAYPHW